MGVFHRLTSFALRTVSGCVTESGGAGNPAGEPVPRPASPHANTSRPESRLAAKTGGPTATGGYG
jgi:hypothetical protein